MPTYWAEKSSPQIKELVKTKKIAIMPIGSTEQHGPHLPLATDHLVAWEVSKKVAEKTDALLLPLLPYGFSDDHFPMAGTLSIGAETLIRIIQDVVMSLDKSAVKHVVLLSGHAGHLGQLSDAAYQLNLMSPDDGIKVHNLSPYTVIPVEKFATILQEEAFAHAEELETSLLLYLRPELVDMSKAVKEVPDFVPKGLTTPNFIELIRILTTSKFLGRDFKTGVCGDATLATREKGEKLFNLMVDQLVRAVNHVTKT